MTAYEIIVCVLLALIFAAEAVIFIHVINGIRGPR